MPEFDVRAIVDAVCKVVPSPAGHHDAQVTDEDRAAVDRALREITNYKPINELERQLEAACNVSHAVVTASGTSALHIALLVAGVKRGDVVLVPSMTFAASAAAVCHCGATPVFADISSSSFGINVYKLSKFLERQAVERNGALYLLPEKPFLEERRIAALMAVHVAGHPCDMTGIMALATKYGVPVIEDAAQALGSSLGNRPCGSWGLLATLSFNYNKVITAGGGGAILTDNPTLAARAHHLVTTARIQHPWLVEHDAVAWNYRMPTICAALASSQMARLDKLVRAKRALAGIYEAVLEGVAGVALVKHAVNSNCWLNVLLVDPSWQGGRDAVLTALHKRGLIARAMFTPPHRLEPYRACVSDNCLVAEDVWRRAVCLPSGLNVAERYV